jgi:hypothetical protein
MRIKKNKKYSVLSRPRFDESYIVGIKKEDTYRKVKNATQGAQRVAGSRIRKSNIVKFEEEYYRYKFYFLVDLRAALNIDKKLSIRFSIRRNMKKTRYPMFSDLDNQKSKGLVASLYGKNKDIRSNIVTADKSDLILRKYINPLKVIDPIKMRSAKKLSDRALFGTIMTTEIKDIKGIKNIGKDPQVAQKTLTLSDPAMINPRGFSSNYERSFMINVDPASLLFGTHDETPADPRKSGTFSSPNLKSGRMIRDETMFSMRSSVKGSTSKNIPNITSISQLSDSAEVVINALKVYRTRIFSTFSTIKKSDLMGAKFFFVLLDLIDSNGIIYQTLKVRIDHEENVHDYYAPKSIVRSKFEETIFSNKNSARVTIERHDENIVGCEIYTREISDLSPLSLSRFRKIKRIKFQKNQNLYQRKQRFTIPTSPSKMTIMRAVAVSKLGDVYGGFSSSTISDRTFIPYIASIYTTSTIKGIRVILDDVSLNVIGVCFERRNVSLNEKKFKKIVRPDSSDKENQAISTSTIVNPVKSKGGMSLKSFAIIDREVREGHLYEYRARLYLDCGVSKLSVTSRFHKFVTPMNMITISVNDIEVKKSKPKPELAEMSGGSSVIVSFDVSYEMASTDTSKLLDALNAAGLDEFYSDDLNEIKSSLNNLIFFSVERFNKETGQTYHLGSFSSEDRITDDGIVTTAPAPVSGQRYAYRVTASLVSPEEAISFIEQKASSATTAFSRTLDLRDPSRISTIRKSAIATATTETNTDALVSENIQSNARKSFSKSSFQKGLLKSPEATIERAEEMMNEYSTGDTHDFNVNTGGINIRANNKNVSMGARSGPIVKWQPVLKGGNVNHLIDFFIVLANKQGEKYIAGTCLNIQSDMCRFVDYSNKDFIGRIEYSIKPVFLNGNLGKEIKIGTAVMVNRNDKFRRGA